MKRLSRSATLALILAASALHVRVASAQATGPGGGCYVCKGILDYVLPEGAYWFGILPADRCPEYLGDRRTSPETRRSYCDMVKAKGLECTPAASVCDSPNGRYCGDNAAGTGALYANNMSGRMYSEPSTGSDVVGSPPSGTRLRYTDTKQVDGQTWYYIRSPGRANGWMPGKELSCARPQEPPPTRIIRDLDSALQPPCCRTTASAARG